MKRVPRWKESVVSETPGKSRKIKTKSPQEDQLGGIRDCGDKLLSLKLGSQVAPMVKNPPANAGDAGDIRDADQSLGREGPLEEGMATHSSVLAWRISWTKEPGRLWSIGLQRVGHD